MSSIVVRLSILIILVLVAFAQGGELGPSSDSADLRGYGAKVTRLAFAKQDNSLLAVGVTPEKQWELTRWSVFTGERLGRRVLHTEAVDAASMRITSTTFSHDASYVAIATQDSSAHRSHLTVYDSRGAPYRHFAVASLFTAIAFSPNSRFLAAGDRHGNLRLWEVSTGRLVHSARHKFVVAAIAFSGDSAYLLTGSARDYIACGPGCDHIPQGDAYLTTLAEPFRTEPISDPQTPCYAGGVDAVTFSPDNTLAVIVTNAKVRFWDIARQVFLPPLMAAEVLNDPLKNRVRGVADVAFAPNGELLAVACECEENFGSSRQIYLWQVSERKLLARLKGHHHRIRNLTFSHDSRFLASTDGAILIWDTQLRDPPVQLKLRHTIAAHRYFLTALAFSPDGTELASGAKEGTVKFWDVATGQQKDAIDYHQRFGKNFEVNGLVYLPGANRLLCAGGSPSKFGGAIIVDRRSLKDVRRLLGHDEPVWSMSVTREGSHGVTVAYDGKSTVWDLKTGNPLRTFDGSKMDVSATVAALSPNSPYLARCVFPPPNWDLKIGELQNTLAKANKGRPYVIAFSPNGNRFVTGDGEGTLTLWDTRTNSFLAKMHWHAWSVRSVAFSPDGRWIAAGSDDHDVTLFDADFSWRRRISSEVGAATARGSKHHAWSIAFSPSGGLLATGKQDGVICIWEVMGN